ncbi:MAG: hypothetical protein IJ017_06830 [Oscillospiraceae bacterium]|nr:hypothetical protein [Oscillospiraceae bacterium]
MSYTQIGVKVEDQTLKVTNVPKLASGGVDVVQVCAEFDAMWDGFEKTAVFYKKLGAVYHVAMDENNCAVVPCEVMKTKGAFYFGIFGENGDGAVRTTEVAAIDVVQGAAIENEAGYEPTPDIYAEILAAAKNAEKIAQSVRDDADAGMFGGGTGKLPTALPNPNELTINRISYDGSKAVNIDLMNWRGEWDTNTGYNTGDVVRYLEALYICLDKNTPTGEIPGISESWELLTEKCGFDASVYYTKPEIDVIMGSYINDIDALVGGDS